MRILVVKAHPHDFTHCAGTLGIHAARGDAVTVVSREKEILGGFRGLTSGGSLLNPLGLFLRTSMPFIWRILSAFLRA
jgi:hypothetical protein